MFERKTNKALFIAGLCFILFVILDLFRNMVKSPHQRLLDTLRIAGTREDLRRLILAQAMHESNNFRSAVYKRTNNAFGYSYVAGNKWQAGKDGGLRYARYTSLENNVQDVAGYYRRRIAKFPPNPTIEQFCTILKAERYYEDAASNYINGVTGWLQVIKSMKLV